MNAWNCATFARLGLRDHLDFGWPALALAAFPRTLSEAGFLILLGQLVQGARDTDRIVVGVSLYMIALATVVRINNVYVVDLEADSFDELRLGTVSYPAVVTWRAVSWCVEGIVYFALSCLVLGYIFVGAGCISLFLKALPFALVAILSTASFGIAVNAFGLGRRLGGLMGPLAASLLLLTSGVIDAPTGPVVSKLCSLLPLHNAVQGANLRIWDESYALQIAQESAVAFLWLSVAVCTLKWLSWLLRRGEFDL